MEGNAITWLCDKKTFPHSAEKASRRREKNYKEINVNKRESENSGQPGGGSRPEEVVGEIKWAEPRGGRAGLSEDEAAGVCWRGEWQYL